ncbi:MAG: heavy metal translocating P-type ATPase, partial [Gammaproteobacteria bacterium]
MTRERRPGNQAGRTEALIAIVSLLGIACHLVLYYGLKIGLESHTFTFGWILDADAEHVFDGRFTLWTTGALLPLQLTVAAGGIPLLFNLAVKLVQGDWGADLLAGIAIVTAVVLNEYLAGAL